MKVDDPATFNRYAYAENNPMTYIDPDGRSIWGDITGGISHFFGGLAGGFTIGMNFGNPGMGAGYDYYGQMGYSAGWAAGAAFGGVTFFEGNGERIAATRLTGEAVGEYEAATFGQAETTNYKKTFFDAYPDLKGNVVVHHAVEQQAMRRYPGVVSESEMHSLENIRGIPKDLNSSLHLSMIRKEWNRFYRNNPAATKEQLLDHAGMIDAKYGEQFMPPFE